ncbi:MAG TPA: cytochrome C oxidase subunit IV family protein [Methylophilaceae bacterium]|nr:cytochrome C oxidase subunit IV family protein [Methylophilaceae bacterium]HQR61330.1 cytochrome C oxidase subunit IV family protein [Methylophilaceae bacterium]
MHFQSRRFSTMIWLLLVGLTLATLGIGEAGLAGKGVMLALLAIALIKGQMVANYFMGLRYAGWLWRGIILAYFLLVGGMIAIAYLVGLK